MRRRVGPIIAASLLLAACKFPFPEDVNDDGRAPRGDSGTADASIDAPALAPMIAFTSDRTGNDDIFTMRIDGTEVTNLTSNPAADTTPLWSPAGDRLAFLSNRSGTVELYVMQADGSRVTNVSQGSVGSMDWSPDGTTLLFDSRRTGSSELFRAAFDGSAPTQLTSLGGAGPRWSPDSRYVAYTNGGRVLVARADLTGSNEISQGFDSRPAWSPDSTRLAFSRRITFVNSDLIVVGRDGTNLTNVTNSPTTEMMPAWSPDGTQIAVVGGNDTNYEIHVISLTPFRDENVSNTAALDWDPGWSLDGSLVSFTSGGEVLAAPRSGGPQINLTNDPADDSEVAWRPTP